MPDSSINTISTFRALRTAVIFSPVKLKAIAAGLSLLAFVFAILAGAEFAMIPRRMAIVS